MSEARFSLMTWNCFGTARGLISFLRWRGVADAARFEHAILRKTAGEIDVFCMQEIYLSEAEAFFDGLAHDHKWRDDNRSRVRPLSFGGSGLGIASRLPVIARSARSFAHPQAHAERFGRKGMVHARVQIDDGIVDVVTTHMQSGMNDAARAIRKRQLGELRAFIADVASDHPVIVCGDFNIDGRAGVRSIEYAEISRALPGFVDLGADADEITFDTEHNALARRYTPNEPRQRLDYVFLRDARGALDVASVERALHERVGDDGSLSDHYALRATFTFKKFQSGAAHSSPPASVG